MVSGLLSVVGACLLSFGVGAGTDEYLDRQLNDSHNLHEVDNNYNIKRSYTPGENEYHFTMSFKDLNPSSSDLNLEVDLSDLVLPELNQTVNFVGGSDSTNYFSATAISDIDYCYFSNIRTYSDRYAIHITVVPGDVNPEMSVSMSGVVSFTSANYSATDYVVSSSDINASRLLGRIFEEYITDINFDLVEEEEVDTMADVITAITTVGSSIATWFVNLFSSLTSIFYDQNGFTVMGTFLLVGISLFIISLVVNWITGLIRVR